MLKCVTFTGIDNKTNIDELVELAKEYPFVEYGVLFSDVNTNKNIEKRFPNRMMLKNLRGKNLNLSCHLCGKIARLVIHKNDWSAAQEVVGKDFDIFQRCQLNIVGNKKFIKEVDFPKDKEIIIQMNKDTSIYDCYKDRANVYGFQDNSGGRGKFSNNWMDSEGYFGYAGGLNIDNIESVIEDLEIVNNGSFWVDMESSIRTNDWFDISKCREICEKVKKYVKD